MKFIVAETAGFCFGVNRAAAFVEESLADGKNRIFTYGELIHNEVYLSSLRDRGVHIAKAADIPALAADTSPTVLVIRAHGIPLNEEHALSDFAQKNPSFSVADMTCPYVKRIHRIADRETDENTLFFLLGTEGHPESLGILSHAKGTKHLVCDLHALENAVIPYKNSEKKAVFVSQTTALHEEFKKCKIFFKKYFTNAKIFDTICSVTENRQKEAVEMCRKADALLVIGSKESSNTMKLYEVAKKNCPHAFLTEDGKDLDRLPSDVHKLGITAGASTPGRIIEEVHKKMNEILENENFEELLNESFRTLNTGDTVTGVISSVSPAELTVDLGTKVTGVIPFDEVAEDSGTDLTKTYKVGDTVTARAIRVSDVEGMAVLSVKQAERGSSFKKLLNAYDEGEVLTGKVTEVVKGGLVVSCKYNRVFIPAGQSGVPKEGDLNELKGQTVRFKLIDMDTERNRAVGSIRSVEREERKAKLEEFWANIEVGKTYVGKVKSLTSFGAFVDLGGIDGMVHTSELSWTKIKNPSEVVSVGQEVSVYVRRLTGKRRESPWATRRQRTILGSFSPPDMPWAMWCR